MPRRPYFMSQNAVDYETAERDAKKFWGDRAGLYEIPYAALPEYPEVPSDWRELFPMVSWPEVEDYFRDSDTIGAFWFAKMLPPPGGERCEYFQLSAADGLVLRREVPRVSARFLCSLTPEG